MFRLKPSPRLSNPSNHPNPIYRNIHIPSSNSTPVSTKPNQTKPTPKLTLYSVATLCILNPVLRSPNLAVK